MSSSAEHGRSLRIAVLLSGGGTTLQNLIDRIADGRLQRIEIACVVSSRAAARGVERARDAGLPVAIVQRRDHSDDAAFSNAVIRELDGSGANLAVMAGWLSFLHLPERWLGRVINIHPSLLPEFGGKGCFGHHVHEAVLAARRPISGATVHWVDNIYDHGQIIMQRSCRVPDPDDATKLGAVVGEIEREILPAAIEMIRDGQHRAPAAQV